MCGLYFPSFSEGLSLRGMTETGGHPPIRPFPFLFGGTFIEGFDGPIDSRCSPLFPFLFGGTFIEGTSGGVTVWVKRNFPSFSEGLSLRVREVLGQLFQQLFPFLFGGTFIEGCATCGLS